MGKYLKLKALVNDYLEHMNEINEQKIELGERELKMMRQEVVCFNLLQKNVKDMELKEEGIKRMNTKEIDPYDVPESELTF
jgi:hypothetical protein